MAASPLSSAYRQFFADWGQEAILVVVGAIFFLWVAPIVIGALGYVVVRPATSYQGLAATGFTISLAIGLLWLGTRYGESTVEVLLSLGLVSVAAAGLYHARRRAARSR